MKIRPEVEEFLKKAYEEQREKEKRLEQVVDIFLEAEYPKHDYYNLSHVLYEFMRYWYVMTGYRGVIVPNKINEYIINNVPMDQPERDICSILNELKNKIDKDGGISEVST